MTGWRPVATEDGTWTLEHPGHGEGCHSRSGAWLEALERYALPCRLAETARERPGPVRLLDVGTGLGWNLVAALRVLRDVPADSERGRRLVAVTLEADPEVIRTGAELLVREPPADCAPEAGCVRDALVRALERPGAEVELGTSGTLVLLLGDARETLPARPLAREFDAVFLDPFSPARAPALWEHAFLARVGRRMAPTGWLSTYSVSFDVRLGLRRAGLLVGRGPAVGAKREGTLASPERSPPPLPAKVQTRLEEALGRPGRGDRSKMDVRGRDPSRGID